MRFWSLVPLAVALAAGATACVAATDGSDTSASGPGTGGGGAAGGSGGDGSGGGSSGPTSIVLPQLVDGAALANPGVFPTIGLRVETEPAADTVEVVFAGQGFDAAPGSSGAFVAELPLVGLTEGPVPLSVMATRGSEVSVVEGEIVVSTSGVQLTDFDAVGSANTPRLHQRDGELWLTWTDRRAGDSEAWLQRLDGAARFMGEPVPLVQAQGETLSARCAFGQASVGVLYQGHGGPYENFFKIVDMSGDELVAPIALDGALYGSFGGEIVFDGEAFVAVWRVNDGMGSSSIQWLRVSEDGEERVGPVTVAASGDEDPHGAFQPISFISLRRLGNRSVVSFVREWYHPTLEMSIPKSQYAMVSDEGVVTETGFLSSATQFTFHREARLFNLDEGLLAVWSAVDLLDPSPTAPNLLFGGASDAAGVFQIIGKGLPVVEEPGDRDEPFVVTHPEHRGLMVWTDNRGGTIELYAATLGADLARGDERMFSHSRFIAGTAELHAVPTGGNAIIVWRDERHGFGILDPRPELWVETAWY